MLCSIPNFVWGLELITSRLLASCEFRSHVWAHFCLSYEGKMLINDKATVRDLGIKDGDQVYFSRNHDIVYFFIFGEESRYCLCN